jgi:YesN/AraC family two-component response regulator
MRVLLVDDESQSRKSLVRVLTRMGLETVVEAATGEEALRLLPQLRPELIITDCQMPGMDGVRLTKALRATGIAMPIIMISGATERAMIDAALRAGVTRFLAKPVEMADLRDALQETIGWASRAA